jgi:hypothetical protein
VSPIILLPHGAIFPLRSGESSPAPPRRTAEVLGAERRKEVMSAEKLKTYYSAVEYLESFWKLECVTGSFCLIYTTFNGSLTIHPVRLS